MRWGAIRAAFAVLLPLLLALPWAAPAKAACERPLIWAWNDFPPYAYRAADGRLTGLDVEIVERVLQEIGCTGQAIELPAKRALAELERGKVDLVAAASITPERQKYGYFSASYRDERVVIFMRADNNNRPLLASAEDLFRIRPRLVASLGGFYGKTFERYEKATADAGLVERRPDIEDRFRMTALDRVDGVVGDDISGADMLRRLGYERALAPAPLILHEAPVYLLVSKESVAAERMAEIDQAIENLHASGALEAIVNAFRVPAD